MNDHNGRFRPLGNHRCRPNNRLGTVATERFLRDRQNRDRVDQIIQKRSLPLAPVITVE